MAAVKAGRFPLVPFTPTAVDSDQLERRTVGRSDILDHLLDGARAAARGLDRAHTLLVAPRGGGKTHVLTLFVHRLRKEEQLARALAVVVVAEDAVDIGSHADLLVAIVAVLGTSAEIDSAHLLRRDGGRAELERLVLAVLDGRPLVLVVENLDRVFSEFGSEGQRQLRAFVETSRAVMLVASAPALFQGVSRRTEPWFGSFAVERLAPWSAEEGAAFLERVAQERGDSALANLIASPTGRARLAAVDRLVGGLPRLWTILAGCITVELLDELVPLVLATLEELVPYYQARLTELPSGERKLVVALCRAETLGSSTGRTVRELALAAGVPEKSAAKLLSRLEGASWVLATKPAGTDRRATWYEIREPLLRYHVAYRRQAGDPLALIVSFLRAWFSPSERRQHLAGTVAGSVAEGYLMESLHDAPAPSDALYDAANPVDLLAGAREWYSAETEIGTSVAVRSRAAAIVAEAVALIALGQTDEVETTLAARLESVEALKRDVVGRIARGGVEAARASAISSSGDGSLGNRQATVQAGLDAAIRPAAHGPLEDGVAVALIAHGWRGATGNHEGAYRGLMTVLERAESLGERWVALRLAVEAELAYFGCLIGERPHELDRMRRVWTNRERALGPDHPDTLTSRHNHACQTGVTGDHATARNLHAALITDRERVLGPDHPNTLISRNNHAYAIGLTGDHATARNLLAALIPDLARVLGPDHPNTLTSRHNHAYETGVTGDHAAARDLYAALIADCERVLSPDHPDTLTSRGSHAYLIGVTGDHATARDLYAALITDCERVLGPDHPDTLTSRVSALAFTRTRAAKRDAALSVLSRPCPPAVESEALRALDGLFADRATHDLDDAQERAALPHLLSLSPGPGLLALVTCAATAPGIASALRAATDDDPARLSGLTAAIIRVAGRQWTRSHLEAWLDTWLAALARSASAEIPRSILDVVRREADGDATARPSLPPELRAILPRVRVAPDDDI